MTKVEKVEEVQTITIPASDIFGGKGNEACWGAYEKIVNKGLLTAEVLSTAQDFVAWFETPTGKLLVSQGDNILVTVSGKIFNIPANKSRVLPLSALAFLADGIALIHDTYNAINETVGYDETKTSSDYDPIVSSTVLDFVKSLQPVVAAQEESA